MFNTVLLRTRRMLLLYKVYMAFAPFWFSMEHWWTSLMPFWFSTEDITFFLFSPVYPTSFMKSKHTTYHCMRTRRALMQFNYGSMMFHWEPEGRYLHRFCTRIAAFWFSMELCRRAITPFWLSTDNTLLLYTEHQKKHHFFRATLTKIHCFKINHIWTHVSYNMPW